MAESLHQMVNFPLFTGFYTSQVVQEFFHLTVCRWKPQLRASSKAPTLGYCTFYPSEENEGNGPVDGSEIPTGPM